MCRWREGRWYRRTGRCWAEIGSGGIRKLQSVVESHMDFTQEGGMIKLTLE